MILNQVKEEMRMVSNYIVRYHDVYSGQSIEFNVESPDMEMAQTIAKTKAIIDGYKESGLMLLSVSRICA
jgi:hypothetical protein